MHTDFYTTTAQVLPVLLLAFLWDSGFLTRLPGQRRERVSREQSRGVRFWTKPRVRAYSLVVATVVVLAIGCALFVLGGLIPDSAPLRWCVGAAVALALGTLLFRLSVDIVHATRQVPPPADTAPAPE